MKNYKYLKCSLKQNMLCKFDRATFSRKDVPCIYFSIMLSKKNKTDFYYKSCLQ